MATRTRLALLVSLVTLCILEACKVDGYYVLPAPEAGPELPIGDWVTRYGGLGDDIGAAVAVATDGDLVVTGSFQDTVTLGGPALSSDGEADAWVARYKADGTFVWSTRLGGASSDRGSGIAVDDNGDVYVVGNFVGPVDFGGGIRNSSGGFLVKLAAVTGAYVWDRVFEASGTERMGAVAILDADTVAVGGSFSGTASFGGGALVSTPSNSPDGFVASYRTTSGEHVWSKVLTTSGVDDIFGGIAVTSGDLIVAGAFKGTGTLGGSPLQSVGDYDVFVARYRGVDGGHMWSMRQGGSSPEVTAAIATNEIHVWIGGGFQGTANLGGSTLSGIGLRDGFVASYSASDGMHVWSRAFGASVVADVRALAASSTRLAMSLIFEGNLTMGSQVFTNSGAAVVRLNFSGDPRVASHVENAGDGLGADAVSLAYTSDRLVGAGSFFTRTRLFGVELTSAGGTDIAAFRVDF